MSRHSVVDHPVVIIGAGAGGLAAALHLAPMPVTVVTQAPLNTEAATGWAQGGIAAVLGADDAAALHAADTESAGAGLVDPVVARRVAEAGPACIEHLLGLGVPFDRSADGALALGLEAAHSRRRIVHAGGDGTGREVLNALVRAARTAPSIHIVDGARAIELAVRDGAVIGVWIVREEKLEFIPARAVVLATGGLGALYERTTNPAGATGSGVALAARAGAVLRDMEFVQFHPTAILTSAAGFAPMPLATEALRGEGALLVNARGERIMSGIAGGELAPRDVVARAVERSVAAGEAVFLDARKAIGAAFTKRFPSVAALCLAAGIDPAVQPIPVRAAAHYHMGGVKIDQRGRSSLDGLWACGEAGSSGLHGANRLASNSLLEALVFARWIAADVAGLASTRMSSPAASPSGQGYTLRPDAATAEATVNEVRRLMTRHVGVIRDRAGLSAAIERLGVLAGLGEAPHPAAAPSPISDMALTGLLIATTALQRSESRGAQFRTDYPEAVPQWLHSIDITLDSIGHAAAGSRTGDQATLSAPAGAP